MNLRSPRTVRGLVLSAVCLTTPSGCTHSDLPPVEALIAIDVSCPAKERLLRYATAIYTAQRGLPAGSQLRIYVFAHGADLIYSGPNFTSRDQLNSSIGALIECPPSHLLARGTQTDKLLGLIASDAARSSLPVSIWIATDGGVENLGANALKQVGDAVSLLGSNSRLRLLLMIGVLPEFRAQWERWLRPLGARATVHGDFDGVETLTNGGQSR